MINRIASLLPGAIAAAVACMLFVPMDAFGQRAGQRPEGETRQVSAMRPAVSTPLLEAQEYAEDGDLRSARRLLDRIRAMDDLNDFEAAQMWNFFAFIYVNEENFPAAIDAYERVLNYADIPEGLEVQTMNTLARLYFQEERYDESLAMLDRWLARTENPQADSFILKAMIYYQLRRFRDGIPEVYRALEVAEGRGQGPQESWYQLLQVFYYELEDFPNLIRTLRTMVQLWPKREHLITLAGIYGQEGQEDMQLALFEAAYEAGWLTRGTEIVNLTNMLMQANVPFKAARVLQRGLDDGVVESTQSNWRLLSQAWQMAQDHEAALPALRRAAELSSDGNLDIELARSYQNLAEWENCVNATREGLRKGDLRRTDQANIMLGVCLAEQKRWGDAETALQAAARDDRSRTAANQWLQFIRGERERERQIAEALARL
jgi:tetratricopeptide (TPR) repeat protein